MSRLSNTAAEFIPSAVANLSRLSLLERSTGFGNGYAHSNYGNYSSWPASSFSAWPTLNSRNNPEPVKAEFNRFQLYSSEFNVFPFKNDHDNLPKFDNSFYSSAYPFGFGHSISGRANSLAPIGMEKNSMRSFHSSNSSMAAPGARMARADNFSEFNKFNLESNVKAIWSSAEFDECSSRLRNCSLSSDCSANYSDSSRSDRSVQSVSKPKMRQIVGRGAGYYQRYGTNCIYIPRNLPINYPPTRRVEALLPLNTGAKGLRKKQWKNVKMECSFCKNIGDGSDDYKTHWLKNSQNVITCPVLRAYTCPLCKNCGGDKAHTIRYCPWKRQKLAEEYERLKNEAAGQSTASPTSVSGGATVFTYDAMHNF